ncbi:MAG: hypothetical protein CMR00_04915 [[Chlorobium] sp. 445]|nr:MAG: hypothetical protein CMR00_04915 [[Chlorobium] sp. 445]
MPISFEKWQRRLRIVLKKDGLTDNQIQTMAFDHEGSLWVGTYRGGLNRFKDGKFLTYTSKQGLVDDIVYGVLQDRDGSYWIATAGGVSHFINGKFVNYTPQNGFPDDLARYIIRTRSNQLYFATYSGFADTKTGTSKISQRVAGLAIGCVLSMKIHKGGFG